MTCALIWIFLYSFALLCDSAFIGLLCIATGVMSLVLGYLSTVSESSKLL